MDYLIAAALFMAGYLASSATSWQGLFLLATSGALVFMLTNKETVELDPAQIDSEFDIEA